MKENFNLFIISPSSYGNDNELMQFYRILMKTGAPALLSALVEKAASWLNAKCNIYCIHERLEDGDVYLQKIFSSNKKKTLVFLTTKSFELPRAIDLALAIKKEGFTVVMGGPGITLADWRIYRYLAENELIFNVGEGEHTVGQIIEDFLNERLKPVYWQKEYVDLRKAPLPVLPKVGEHKKCFNPLVGFSTSEGCPFNCSFCCVTTLRGRNICEERSREPEAVVGWIEKVHHTGHAIMLTDDNFRRSYHYERIKELLIGLNKKFTRKLRMLVQVDASADIEKEIPELARMGVNHVFIGMESLDQEVLDNISKTHNKPENYQRIADKFRKYGILVHSGAMVGFPYQTPDSIYREIGEFRNIIDLMTVFCATPFPGSKDYEEAVAKGWLLTDDLNFYDTRHMCRDWFSYMTPKEAEDAYNYAVLFSSKLKGRLGNNRSLEMIRRNFRCNTFAQLIAWLGYAVRGYPYCLLMDGIPRKAKVFRTENAFKGFHLEAEDLAKKTEYLEAITGGGLKEQAV